MLGDVSPDAPLAYRFWHTGGERELALNVQGGFHGRTQCCLKSSLDAPTPRTTGVQCWAWQALKTTEAIDPASSG